MLRTHPPRLGENDLKDLINFKAEFFVAVVVGFGRDLVLCQASSLTGTC